MRKVENKKIQNNDDVVTFRMDKDVKYALKAYCARRGLVMGRILAEIVAKFLNTAK